MTWERQGALHEKVPQAGRTFISLANNSLMAEFSLVDMPIYQLSYDTMAHRIEV
jgi:hypothetical protein